MAIWVDADACPRTVREILFRASARTKTTVTFVANSQIRTPAVKEIRFVQVPKGFDVADQEILNRSKPGDLVITGDISLAADLLKSGVSVISPRGEQFSTETVGQKLNIRDFLETMRSSGEHTGGSRPMSKGDSQKFGNSLDQYLAKSIKSS